MTSAKNYTKKQQQQQQQKMDRQNPRTNGKNKPNPKLCISK